MYTKNIYAAREVEDKGRVTALEAAEAAAAAALYLRGTSLSASCRVPPLEEFFMEGVFVVCAIAAELFFAFALATKGAEDVSVTFSSSSLLSVEVGGMPMAARLAPAKASDGRGRNFMVGTDLDDELVQ
eukprot:CAMPEP_0201688284 /NCGR_PEP_ID=MMETSP0578-20130828/2027_1 /ASSEMBLY_ACC=CAM_ASM_000663 /TAXON_ID=267565 /ORGANISM="Skeletonema grethea, Strain CCMP 1804" /LENGTH=128 /DNA_ID=CAMNT_0048172533 /DNA_START=45 /DNA_END=430 /DNA_ORIENTATION=-